MENSINYYDRIINITLNIIQENIDSKGKCDLMLTGGKTARLLYRKFSSKVLNTRNITYYFGDERCVPSDSCDSNFKMVSESLFANGVPSECEVKQINGEVSNVSHELLRYSSLLPKSIDILLLSVGEDGHIASLFPLNSHLCNNKERMLYVSNAPKYPSKRITISPLVIKKAKSIIVMAEGEEKGMVLAKALQNAENVKDMPVRLTIKKNTIWMLDKSATLSFQKTGIKNDFNIRIMYA
mgnify:CR=1 FL=1